MNALDMDYNSCGFDRARFCPVKIIKGANKAAYYPKMRHSPKSMARRFASPDFLLAVSSHHAALDAAGQGRRRLRRD
jgi:hypothetical protein